MNVVPGMHEEDPRLYLAPGMNKSSRGMKFRTPIQNFRAKLHSDFPLVALSFKMLTALPGILQPFRGPTALYHSYFYAFLTDLENRTIDPSRESWSEIQTFHRKACCLFSTPFLLVPFRPFPLSRGIEVRGIKPRVPSIS